ncbi:MAG: ABC transporter substrate-binding protein [Deferribacteres bacterium]|nr:ABC transporter substrate-binding protein [Deferribacteres bacterium]
MNNLLRSVGGYLMNRQAVRHRVIQGIFMGIFVLLLLVPAGCTKKAEEGKTTLHFVTWKPNIPEAWEEIYSIFRAEHPDIELVRETGPHSSTAFHDLLTQKLKNRSEDVDVFLMDVIWPPEFAAAGWAAPLDEMFAPSERKEFLEGAILANSYNGKIYGVPLFIDSGILYYRRDLLEKYGFKPPRTWQEMVEQAEKITAGEAGKGVEIYGFSGQFKQYEGLVCDMMEYILSNGGNIINPKTGKSGIAEKPAVEAVRFVRDNIIGKIAPAGVLTYQEPESLDLFIQGKAVFHRNWPYAWEVSNNPKRSTIAGKVGIARLPHFPGGRSYSTLGGWQAGISSYSKNKEAAWTFVKFLTSERIQKLLALKAGRAPTRKKLYGDAEILKAYPHFSGMKDVFLTAYPRPRTPLYPAVSNVLQRYFSKAISDPSSDIEKEALSASQEIDRLLSLAK